MIALMPTLRAAFAVVVLLGSLSLVTWRQSRALEALGRLDDIRREASVTRAEIVSARRQIQSLESRARVVPAARARLGMHTPDASELVLLTGEVAP